MIGQQTECWRRADCGEGVLEMIATQLPDRFDVQRLGSLSNPRLELAGDAHQHLAGLAEADSTLRPGQAVSVYIKNILPDKMKIKLVVVNKNLGQPLRFEPHYFVTRGRLKRWTYSTPQSRKQIETVF